MKSSLVTLAFFLFGCVAGVSYAVDFDVHQTSVYVLYVLMLLLGINLGSNRNLRQFVLSLNFRTLLVPLATVSGTLLFSAIGGFLLSRWSIFDCMAVGSGFSYYSVSSILITQIKSPSIGVQLATELGTIALLSNIFREMTALIGAPLSANISVIWHLSRRRASVLPTFPWQPSHAAPDRKPYPWPSSTAY